LGEIDGSDEIRRKIEALRLALGPRGPRGARGPQGPGEGAGLDAGEAEREREREQERGQGAPGPRIEDLEGSREIASGAGKCLAIEKTLEGSLGLDVAERGEGRTLVFLDLETTGLSATPLFLAGVLVERSGELRAIQLLARDYSEERCLIAVLDDLLAGFDICVTFNGKSFDIPYLKERAKYHRLALRAAPEQLDLLHHARRRWKHRLPDCRLLTLEWFILGRRRMGDVGGWEVPCIYHEFVHTGDATRLKQVLRHNFMDLVSMAELFVSLAEA
jgi:uncharacterized protein YprB with RNaseH-like and TPR domain